MLLLPTGESAGMIDPPVLLLLWSHYLGVKLRAGLGKPTFPVNKHVVDYATSYWQNLSQKINNASQLLTQEIVDADLAIDYGDPHGDKDAREKMAHALTKWYQCEINAQDILFTTGGVGGLYCVFEYLQRKYLKGRILTTFPYYPYYSLGNHLLSIPVMDNPGYRLTADLLEKSIKATHEAIHAVVLCYPNNPLGTVLRKNEWQDIAKVLEQLPNVLIILDEAYAELDFTDDGASLFSVAPQLRDRIVLMRSGTKGLSAAGERLAVLVCQNPAIMARLLEINVTTCFHPPRHLQMAFAQGLDAFTDENKQQLKLFYQPQIEYVQKRLQAMNAQLPDPDYKIEGSFYVLANLKALLGTPMSEAANKVFTNPTRIIQTDEELVYTLLFEDNIMLMPGSYFGLDPSLGYVRITCSIGERDLGKILDVIERRLGQL
ncbi:MAG: pyridoxal phosphate-dependent aminotransferase [Legionellales bacterium]|jgi:aspartate aminotransferase/aminotransferase